eukprot:COSAG05_NODE_4832_length_1356_cov_0.990453_2_plen_158_part_00
MMLGRTIAALALAAVSPARAAEERSPSVLFVVADDLGWQDVGWREVAPGKPTDMQGATNFLDTLSAEGVKLDQNYVSPVCSPTRAQLLTGQYGVRLGFLDVLTPITSPGHLPLDVPSLAEGIRAAGCVWPLPSLSLLGLARNTQSHSVVATQIQLVL